MFGEDHTKAFRMAEQEVREYFNNRPDYLQPGWRTANKGPNPDNKSGFRATGHRLLLITEEVEEFSAGGIALVAKTQIAEANRAQVCTVLEIGPDAWSDKSTDYCDVGDRVLIGQYVGKFHESPVDGKTYRFVSDLDVISPLPKVEK
jgi:co-chaperonin GroES (HSP10)